MSGQTTTNGSTDVVDDSGQTFAVEVPSGTSTPVSYLRMGVADTAAETSLPQDPAATGSAVKAISATTTTSPFSAGELVYTAGTTQIVAPYGYIRVGTPTTYESWLPSDPDASDPAIVASNEPQTNAFAANGIVLYSYDSYQLYSPSITTTSATFTNVSGNSLSVVHEGPADFQASYTNLGPYKFTATYQTVNQMNSTIGAVTNLAIGNTLTYWLGNDASTGLGSLLWSNFGVTQNIFAGMVVNIINGMIDIQGWSEVKIQPSYSVDAVTSLNLNVAPPALAAVTETINNNARFNRAASLFGVITTGAITGLGSLGIGVAGDLLKDPDKMRDAMIASYAELAALTGIVAALQISALVSAQIVKAQEAAFRTAALAKLEMKAAGVTISAGPGGATQFVVTETGVWSRALMASYNNAQNAFT